MGAFSGGEAMSMETTCPKCGTVFRVTTEQLNVHQGDVRCGVCATLFNAFDSLAPAREGAPSDIPLHAEAAAEISVTPPASVLEEEEAGKDFAAEEEKTPAPEVPLGAPLPQAETVPQEEVLVAPETPAPEESMPEESFADFGEALEQAPAAEPQPVEPKSVEHKPAEIEAIEEIYADFVKEVTTETPVEQAAEIVVEPPLPSREAEAPPSPVQPRPAVEAWEPPTRKKRSIWPWALGSLPLLLLLAGQALYFYRIELAATYPGIKPNLEQACQLLGCSVPLPRNADLLKIESSDLEADTEHPSQVTLASVISNRAKYRQAYPMLELTLTDHADQVVARRVFTPAEYLPPASDTQRGIAANGEMSVRLSLDLGDLNAVGYRLYVFYAVK